MNDAVAAGEVIVVCPFCRGTVHAYASDEEAWVVHTVPVCRPYEEMAAEDYFHEVHELYKILVAAVDPSEQSS